ncbi:hypothetical protein FRC10_003827 [Ceratobasidium sp. 414]|nr:hypothetical protein FRC10_003827 [Ceratobasidium sp. 414]
MALIRDSTYYFNDRGIVLQVEDVLFKIEISHLANHSEVFKNMLEVPPASDGAEGTSDANPVILPQIEAEEFRSLLFIFYQSPFNRDFISFMSGASDSRNQNPPAFKRYLDIARLSRRFCMPEGEEWAKTQLQEFQNSSSSTTWLKPTQLLATLSYAKLCSDRPDDEFTRKVNSKLRYVVTQCDGEHVLELYRTLPVDADRALQGLVFLRVLKDGHKSPLWAKLTWTERANLYAVQVNLTPLPSSWPFNTLKSGSDIYREVSKGGQSLCHFAQRRLLSVWNGISSDHWDSDAPLRGVTEAIKLPGLKRELDPYFSGSQMCTCRGAGAKCQDALLAKVDDLVEALFTEIANLRDRLSNQ